MACATVWTALGDPTNYVEPFAGSAAMLLGRPRVGAVETINDADGFIANFWRAISQKPEEVAEYADWPTNEIDLFARHSWLVRQAPCLLERLHADPDYYDAKIAGWWCWGACNWIGSGWCSGNGPWVHDGERLIDARTLPRLCDRGQGVNRKLPHLCDRRDFLLEWFCLLQTRLRHVRVAVGDWQRVLSPTVTTRHGLTGIFLDPPYARGAMDYTAGGVGSSLSEDVRAWCLQNGNDKRLRIVLCGHAGDHDELLSHGWRTRKWKARRGYALTEEAQSRNASEMLWCSPHCIPESTANLF